MANSGFLKQTAVIRVKSLQVQEQSLPCCFFNFEAILVFLPFFGGVFFVCLFFFEENSSHWFLSLMFREASWWTIISIFICSAAKGHSGTELNFSRFDMKHIHSNSIKVLLSRISLVFAQQGWVLNVWQKKVVTWCFS